IKSVRSWGIEKMIYLRLAGRIGNQLFMYAYVRTLQHKKGDYDLIIDDSANIVSGYINSLKEYNLPDCRYVSDNNELKTNRAWRGPYFWLRVWGKIKGHLDYRERYNIEKRFQPIFNRLGVISMENGYIKTSKVLPRNILVDGYFQSESFFAGYEREIRELFSLKNELERSEYPNLDKIRSRNTVCISIKVQHNVGNKMFDVCNHGYWEEAIEYMIKKVENPLFFVCSDNIPYVKEHLIDCTKYDMVEQAADFPVHISLAAMAECKHFIIGNTSYGWWAQYLSEFPDKIVVAPSEWYGIDVPCDIGMETWHRIEVGMA
ncbi:MAG: alpha-1,2-fucosyltransferase, partial [Clostridium sp.]|nr:alpha-1,2-fucosyltransferase [Clostridium sp.]